MAESRVEKPNPFQLPDHLHPPDDIEPDDDAPDTDRDKTRDHNIDLLLQEWKKVLEEEQAGESPDPRPQGTDH